MGVEMTSWGERDKAERTAKCFKYWVVLHSVLHSSNRRPVGAVLFARRESTLAVQDLPAWKQLLTVEALEGTVPVRKRFDCKSQDMGMRWSRIGQ